MMYLIQPNMDVLLLNVSCLILHQNHHNFNKTDIFHDHSLHCKTFNVFNSTRKRFIKISLHPLLVKIWEKTSTQSKFKTCYIHDFLQISNCLGSQISYTEQILFVSLQGCRCNFGIKQGIFTALDIQGISCFDDFSYEQCTRNCVFSIHHLHWFHTPIQCYQYTW